jgi:hypothetical protein
VFAGNKICHEKIDSAGCQYSIAQALISIISFPSECQTLNAFFVVINSYFLCVIYVGSRI